MTNFEEILKYAHNDYDKEDLPPIAVKKKKIEARNTGGQRVIKVTAR